MIHSRSAIVLRHFAVAGEEIAFRPHLINQPEPYVSFHALFERGQHALRPYRAFGPCPVALDRSALWSRCRHYRRSCFAWYVHHASIFLRPFAPPALPGFNATMDALTSDSIPCRNRISLFNMCKLPTVPSPTTLDRPRRLVCFCFRGLPRDLAESTKATPVPVGRIVTWASPLASVRRKKGLFSICHQRCSQ